MHFIDLQTQYRHYRHEIDDAIRSVLDSSLYVNGPQVARLEEALAAYVGCRRAVAFSSGTDALLSILLAWGIGPGDEVITTPFTFIATAEVIALVKATPVFVDVRPDTLNLDPELIETAITPRTRAIIPVSLFGQCADFDAINPIAERHGLHCLEDACQSLGARHRGRYSGNLTEAAATSFFPAKPLGGYGDGGMAFTNEDTLADRLMMIREHGQQARYRHAVVGINGRLDTLQAAILLAKLPHFEAEVAARQEIAARYYRGLQGLPLQLPVVAPDQRSVYSQFTVRLPNRDQVAQALSRSGIPTAIHYPVPLHGQPAFAALGYPPGALPVATRAAGEVLSLPMHPFLTLEDQERVIEGLRQAVAPP